MGSKRKHLNQVIFCILGGRNMRDSITIRESKSREEAADIALLAGKVWREYYTPIIGAAQVEYMLEKFQCAEKIYEDMTTGGYVYYTALDEGNLIGYCAVKTDGSGGIFLSKLYVQKEARGRGIGKLFVRHIQDKARKEGFSSIWLTVNKNNLNSIEAYKRMGFRIIESVVSDIGNGFVMDDYKMRLEWSI